MEEQNLLLKIGSEYVLGNINSYIPSDLFIYKLIVHCKSLQKKLKIKLCNYQALFYSKRIDLNKVNDNKDILNLLRNKFRIEDEELFKQRAIDYFQLIKPNIYDYSLTLRLESPFSDIFLKNDIVVQYSDIFIPILEMRENDLLELYKNKIKELNKSNSKYCSLYLQFGNPYDKSTINSFHLKFNQIAKLQIDLFNFRFHYNPLFSMNDLRNNLIYLSLNNIEIPYRYGLYPPEDVNEINKSVLQVINELTSLKYLKLSGFNFNKDFVLSLSHLKKLSIQKCQNLILENDIFLELNTLELKFYSNIMPKSLLNCPEIKECYFDNEYSNPQHHSIINFASLQKLEKFAGHWKDFLYLENAPLEEIKLGNYIVKELMRRFEKPTEIEEEQIFEKICSIKSLKSIYFGDIIGYSLPRIKTDNKSVSKITIRLENNLNYLQKIFPNLTDISIRMNKIDNKARLAIKEIIKSKIKKFSFFFDCEGFSIFDNNNNEILYNLKIFHLKIGLSDLVTIENIYNNINNMPNLEDIKIISNDKFKGNYEDFINKILHLKFIRKVKIIKKKPGLAIPEYTIEELKILFPDINFNAFFEIRISK